MSGFEPKNVSQEIKTLLARHNEVLVIYADPVDNSDEISIGAFIKMLDKDKNGKLANLLDEVLTNIKATYSEKRGSASHQATAHQEKDRC